MECKLMKKNKYSGYKDIFEVQKYILNTFDVCEIDYDKKIINEYSVM